MCRLIDNWINGMVVLPLSFRVNHRYIRVDIAMVLNRLLY